MSTHDVSSINICIHKRTHDTTTITKIDNVTFFGYCSSNSLASYHKNVKQLHFTIYE